MKIEYNKRKVLDKIYVYDLLFKKVSGYQREGLHKLKNRYGISIRLLVNIAIRNVLIEEGIIEENKKKCIY